MAHHEQQDPQYPQQWHMQPGRPHFQPHYSPPPGYGPPPQPPKKSNTPLILIAIGAVALLMFGSCSVVLALASSNMRDVVTEAAPVTEPTTRARLQDETQPEVKDETEPQGQVAEPDPATVQPSAKIGGTLTLHGRDPGLLVKVTITNVFDRATPAHDFLKPKTGNRYVAIELRLENAGQIIYDDSPSNGSKLIDDQGQQYRPTFADIKEGVSLGGGVAVTVGDRRKGVLVFELPADVKPEKFQFALDSGFAKQKGEWTLIK